MQIVILSGGLGKRLGTLTRNTPKSLIRISGKPFLEYQLDFLTKAEIKKILLCTGHMGEQIEIHFGSGEKYGVNIRYNHEDKPLGTAGALRYCEEKLDDPFITIYGDSYVFLDFNDMISYFQSQDKLALMTVYKNSDRYGWSNTSIQGNLVKQYSKKNSTGDMEYIDYGVNVFRKRVLDMIPKNQFYSLEDLFPKLIEQEQLLAYEVYQRFYEIGSPEGLADFKHYVTRRRN
jgi:NDP-sugar pyrophosphorylase family protein